MKSDFELLGLEPTAAPEEVRAAYHRLALVHHPDRGGDAGKMSELSQAFKRAIAEAEAPKPCVHCDGRGIVLVARGFMSVTMPCPACGGKRA